MAARLGQGFELCGHVMMQVYKGVLSPGEFNAMVDELTSGPCMAFEVADRDGANPVEQVRP